MASRSRSPVCIDNTVADRSRGYSHPESAADHRALFKSKAERQERTELLVLITPRLVRPLNPDEVPPLPTHARTLPAAW